jgi:hypothetical protein
MTDTSVTSITATYQQGIAVNPHVPATTYESPTLGASGVANKLFFFLVQLTRRWHTVSEGCGADSKQYGVVRKCLGASTRVLRTITDGEV